MITREFKLIVLFVILCFSNLSFAQDSIPDSTNNSNRKEKKIFLNESDFESIITYSARDSIFSDVRKQRVHMYGDAKLNYDGIDMFADYLMIDLEKNEVLATYTTDSTGKAIGKPLFIDNGDTLRAASIRYNFDTKKGYIQEATIKQDEYYLSMEKAKRQANEEIHFVHGKFTTCNLEEPHYHFGLSKAILIPEKRIVSGPMNLWVMGVPTPLGLPFAIIPIKDKGKDRKSGFIMPQYSIASAYGMGVQDLGYYFPISDKFQTTAYVTAFTRGSFGVRNYSEYARKYKFSGNFDVGYTRFRYGFPDSTALSTTTFKWNHMQDPKLNPNWTFSANVNFNSNSSNKKNINMLNNDQYFNNTLNSDILLGKKFGALPISANMKLSMRQNSATKIIDLTSPIVNFQTTNRIYPFKKVNKVVGFSYSNEIQNRSSFKDQYLKKGQMDSIGHNYRNGVMQNFNVQATFSIFKSILRLTPSATYKQVYNFQSIVKNVDAGNVLKIDTLGKGGFSHSFTTGMSLTTNFYSYYRFIGKRKTLLRHVMTPTVSFNYAPNIQMGKSFYTDTSGKTIEYSRYERSLYSEYLSKSSGRIAFGLSNTFELKQKSSKDTLTGFKKTRIIDNLFLNTEYDMFKDSMKWSNLNMRLVINPNKFINLTISASHSWYGWDDSTGRTIKTFAFKNGQGIGRIQNASFATSLVLTSKKNRDKLTSISNQMSNVWNPEYQQWILNPNHMVYFEIPWKITLDHIFSLNLNQSTLEYRDKHYLPTNTLSINGDVNITPNWKIAARMFYDIERKTISNLNINLYRNIHCWNVTFNWVPIGTNKSFVIGIRGNASALQNANINIRKPPIVLE